ncbi:MAG: asparagine synthase, partial [Desulfobacteraceae bacterium]
RYFSAFSELLFSFFQRTVLWQFRLSTARRYIPFLITNRNSKQYLKANGFFEPVWSYASLRERQLLDIDKYSVPALTHYEDRTSMAHSLEIRLPFLDHRLVNFLVNLPVRLKMHNGWSKYILRKSMKELPEAIRWRRDKQGFSIPEEIWLKTGLCGMIERIFSKSRLHEMGIIEDRSFLEYYHQFQRGAGAIWYLDISRVLIAELWARKFFHKN